MLDKDRSNNFESKNSRLQKYVEDTDWQAMSAVQVLRWAFERFNNRAVLATSFQQTGMVMLHMAHTAGIALRMATIDTRRLHSETYSFIEKVQEKYSCQIERWHPKNAHVDRMVSRFGEYLFFDSKEKQEHCCDVRKTKPRNEMLKTVDCWLSGQRWDQSEHRRQTANKVAIIGEYGTQRKLVKLNPLVDWTDQQVDDYVRDNDVPIHPLYEQGYPSFGCRICATPILPGEDKRAGRWRWFNNSDDEGLDDKECGLHYTI